MKTKSKMYKVKTIYMCSTQWESFDNFYTDVFLSLKDLKDSRSCYKKCGVIKVLMMARKVRLK